MTFNCRQFTLGLLTFLFPSLHFSLQAGDFEWLEPGLRIGLDGEASIDVRSYQVFAVLESPWEWDLTESIEVEMGVEFGLGALDGEGETAAFGQFGPSLKIELGDLPFEFIITSGPVLLSEHRFDRLDLGGSFQFMTLVGFDFEVYEDWKFGYRIQHISNAGLHDRNPGLDLHAINLSYNF